MGYKINSLTRKTYITASIILLLICAIGGVVLYRHTLSYPLGSKLEYIGKVDYGCWLVCDSNPASTYYYATDMSVNDVIAYFKRLHLEGEVRTINEVADFSLTDSVNNDVSIYYYNQKQAALHDNPSLRSSQKKYIISVPDFDYQLAKSSL